jgi:hypothetical protein
MTSIHELAIQRLVKNSRDVAIHTGGLGKFMAKLIKQYDIDMDKEEVTSRRPDAWSYEPFERPEFPGTLTLYEVEDTHPISVDKMREYAEFAFDCDFYYLDVKLKVLDRYGENEREIDLIDYFIMFKVNDAKKKGERPKNEDYEEPFERALERMGIK